MLFRSVAKTTQMLAHDIRKPFSLVKMGLSRLATAGNEEEIKAVAARLAEEAGRAMEGANRMIQDLLASGRAADASRRDVALATIVARSCEEVFAGRSATGIALTVDVDEKLCVRVDALEIQRVVSNVVDNAFEALGSSGGKIWIRAQLTEGRDAVSMIIGNDGPAIPAEIIPQLFEAYFTKDKTDGTGLGLAIAQEIIAAHGGHIACRSDKVGTEFHFLIPCTRPPLTIRPERIAVIDDNPFVLDAWGDKLGTRLALSSVSPEAFWQKIAAQPLLFDELTLVITDQDFGNASTVDGLAFAADIKARRANLQVLLSSDMPVGNQTTFIRGIDGVLPKEPVDAPRLVALFN